MLVRLLYRLAEYVGRGQAYLDDYVSDTREGDGELPSH